MKATDLNAAMPLGKEMSTYDVLRAMEGLMGMPLLTGAVVYLLRSSPQIEGGKYNTRFRAWKRTAEITEREKDGPDYPCEVRQEQVMHTTGQGNPRVNKITVPKEPWL